jgi:hypothetical protein
MYTSRDIDFAFQNKLKVLTLGSFILFYYYYFFVIVNYETNHPEVLWDLQELEKYFFLAREAEVTGSVDGEKLETI